MQLPPCASLLQVRTWSKAQRLWTGTLWASDRRTVSAATLRPGVRPGWRGRTASPPPTRATGGCRGCIPDRGGRLPRPAGPGTHAVGGAPRKRWRRPSGRENALHWVLDVGGVPGGRLPPATGPSCGARPTRACGGHARTKLGMENKRLKAGRNRACREEILGFCRLCDCPGDQGH